MRRWIDLGQAATPAICGWSRWWSRGWRLGGRVSPLRSWRTNCPSCLVRLRMDVLRKWSTGLHRESVGLAAAEELKASFDVHVLGIELGGSLVGIQGIVDLVVARFIL
jgi:hypothetical protein